MLVEWFAHSCFRVSANGYSIVLDPYKPKMFPKLKPYHLEANMVLASHEHDDHNYRKGVKLLPKKENPFQISYIETFHDKANGTKRGKNKITILEIDNVRIAHMGDLGCMLEESQYEQLMNLDAILIPVGGFFTINATEAKAIIDRVKPRIIIPMHFRGKGFGFPVLGTLQKFVKQFDKEMLKKHSDNQIEVTKDTPEQVALLKYQ